MGNLALARNDAKTAKRQYKEAFDICYNLGPTQIFVSSIYYKLGLVEMREGNIIGAMYVYQVTCSNYDCRLTKWSAEFDKGISIAEYRNIKGQIALLYRQKADALTSLPGASENEIVEAEVLTLQAEILRLQVVEETEQTVMSEPVSNDEGFDNLVCDYFRWGSRRKGRW